VAPGRSAAVVRGGGQREAHGAAAPAGVWQARGGAVAAQPPWRIGKMDGGVQRESFVYKKGHATGPYKNNQRGSRLG
jgi:hypothetical protein